MNIRHAWRRPTRKPASQWIAENYKVLVSAQPGPWKHANSPHMRAILDDFSDDACTRVGVRAAAQGSKSEGAMAGCAWNQDQDPDPSMWVAAEKKSADLFCSERLMPSMEEIPSLEIRMPRSRTKKKTASIQFRTHVFDVVGAASITQLQSKPRRWLWLDEVRNWKGNRLPTVEKRVGTFWNEKINVFSTPGREDDAVDTCFKNGDQRHWHVYCRNPKCVDVRGQRHHAPMDFYAGMKWDENDETFPRGLEGTPNFEKLAKTIRYECPRCHHVMRDTPENRDYIARTGFWFAHNRNAPAGYRTYTWSKMILARYSWRRLVQEYLEAKRARIIGNFEKMELFVTEGLGLPFKDSMKYPEDEDPIEKRKISYVLGELWDQAKYRIMTVDVQAGSYYYVVRDWSAKGHSRLAGWGSVPSIELLRGVVTEMKVGRRGMINSLGQEVDTDKWFVNQNYVCIDTGKWAARLYKYIVESGYQWKAFKGAGEAQRGTWKDENGVVQIYTQSEVDPYLGKAKPGFRAQPITLTSLNDFKAQDMMTMYLYGEALPWYVPTDIDPEYVTGLMSEKRIEVTDPYGGVTVKWVRIHDKNHIRDCEKMQFIAALLAGILRLDDTAEEESPRVPVLPIPKPVRGPELPEADFEYLLNR